MMQRRDFLKAAAVAAGPVLMQTDRSKALADDSDGRFGDLLIRPRATDHFELLFTPSRPRPMRLLQLADTHFHPGDDTNRETEKMLRAIVSRERPDFIVHTGDFVNNDSDKPVDWTGMELIWCTDESAAGAVMVRPAGSGAGA